MSERAAKKLRKLYKKDLAGKAEKEAHELATTFFTHVVKPKPRFFPLWLCSALFRIFVNVPDDYKPNFSRERGFLNG
ncbi:MAG: hypothetical protein KAR06_02510 [Deltaproteobacteria bacterium]|nr:hypothetical protein [Deltaproteobacteria bacterium]